MIETQDKTPAEKDGKYEFKLSYAERELTCQVIKDHDILHVHLENNMDATLKLNPDGSLTQTDGATLPQSSIDFIKKHIFGPNV